MEAFFAATFLCAMQKASDAGLNSLISAPSAPSLISTEPVELLCRASNISYTDPFCFVIQKQETVEAFLQFFVYKYAQLHPACAERKFTAVKVTLQPQKQSSRGTNTQAQTEIRSIIRLKRKFTTRFAMFSF